MTLFRQLALIISFITLITLSAVMYINYESAKKNMIENLYQTTVNNISSLANNLAQAADDTALLSSIIDAEFDSGYYKKIKFVSNDDSFTYEQIDTEPIQDVPLWFIKFTKLHLKSITSDVSSGWSSIGEVEVLGDTAVVYGALYTMLKNLLFLFVVLAILSHIMLSILLHFVLKPLKQIQNQAEAITRNEFVIQKKEPYTTEFKDLVRGMNSMVKKVEDIFNKANEAVQKNRELLYNDPVTKLYNRRYLMLKLPEVIQLENSEDGGTILFVAFNSVEILDTILGKQKADEFLYKFSAMLQELTVVFDEKIISRVNQTEITLVLSACHKTQALEIVTQINQSFNFLRNEYLIKPQNLFINIGLYKYRQSIQMKELLTYADNALSKAKVAEKTNFYLYHDKNEQSVLGKEQWRGILEDAIQNDNFKLIFYSMLDTLSQQTQHKVMTFIIDDNKDKKYFYGDFIASAINLSLVNKVYLVALKNLLTQRHVELDASLCCVRLSNEFLKASSSLDDLSSLLQTHIKDINFILSFEISDNFALNNMQLVKSFVSMFTNFGISFGLNSFTSDSNDFTYLKELNPAFIKADSSFLLDQSQESMHALQVIADSLSINIIATFVKTQEEIERLSLLHVYKIQGPITESITVTVNSNLER